MEEIKKFMEQHGVLLHDSERLATFSLDVMMGRLLEISYIKENNPWHGYGFWVFKLVFKNEAEDIEELQIRPNQEKFTVDDFLCLYRALTGKDFA